MSNRDTPLRVGTLGDSSVVVVESVDAEEQAAAVLAGIQDALARAEDRLVVLVGSPRSFFVSDVENELRPLLADACERLACHRLPVLAVLPGPAHDAGLELALACDLRFAARGVTVGMPAVRAGRLPVGGGQRLIHEAGAGLATRLLLLGELLSAGDVGTEALLEAVDEPRLAAEAVALELAERAPLALQAMKTAILAAAEMPPRTGFAIEADLASLLLPTHDRAEGIAAFRERRPPRFDGR